MGRPKNLSLEDKHEGLVKSHKALVKTNTELKSGLRKTTGCLISAGAIVVILVFVMIAM